MESEGLIVNMNKTKVMTAIWLVEIATNGYRIIKDGYLVYRLLPCMYCVWSAQQLLFFCYCCLHVFLKL